MNHKMGSQRRNVSSRLVCYYYFYCLVLLLALFVVTPSLGQTNNDNTNDNAADHDDDDAMLDLDSLPVPTPIPADDYESSAKVPAPAPVPLPVMGESSSSSSSSNNNNNANPQQQQQVDLPVPTNYQGDAQQHANQETTNQVPASKDTAPTNFGEGAYPTESLSDSNNYAKNPATKYHVAGVGGDEHGMPNPGGSTSTTKSSSATTQQVPTRGPSGSRDDATETESFSEGAYPTTKRSMDTVNVPSAGSILEADASAKVGEDNGLAEGAAHPTTTTSTTGEESVPTVWPSETAHEKTEKDEEDKERGFAEGAYPTETGSSEAVPTVWPADDETTEESFSEGAYPTSRMDAAKANMPVDYSHHTDAEASADDATKNDDSESDETSPETNDAAETDDSTTPDTVEETDQSEHGSFSEGAYPSERMTKEDNEGGVPTPPTLRKETPVEDTPDGEGGDEASLGTVSSESTTAGSGDETNDASASEPAKKEGSLASFFEKVNKKKETSQDRLSNTFEAASQVYTDQAKREGIWTGEAKKPYCGVWGTLKPNQQRPDLNVLFELFQEAFVEAITGSHTKAQAEALVDEMGDLLESKTADVNVDDVMAKEPKGKPQLSNEFVEGLDDIDKLFEDVDPPDELDIGSLGSSMQEILVGRTSHIVRKRLMMGIDFIKKTSVKAKDAVANRLKREDGRIRFVSKEQVVQAGRTTWHMVQKSYKYVVTFVDDLIGGDSDDDEDVILGDDAYLREEIQKRAVPAQG